MKALIALAAFTMLLGCSSTQKPSTSSTASPSPTPTPKASPAASAPTVPAGAGLDMTCKSGSDERGLTIVPKDQGCELHYSKYGKGQIVASSAVTQSHCERVRSQIVKNLEASGFVCR